MENEEKIQQLARNGEKGSLPPITAVKAPADRHSDRYAQVEKSSSGTAAISPDQVQESENLPESYGETKVMLLPVEPYLIHAYWEFSQRQSLCLDEEQGKIKHRVNGEQKHTRPILRCYEVSSDEDWKNTAPYFDVNIDLAAGNCYVPLFKAGNSYLVELGFKTRDGHFFAAAQSNIVETPRTEPLPEKDESTATKETREYSPPMANHKEFLPDQSDTLESFSATAKIQPQASLKEKERLVKAAITSTGGPGDKVAEKNFVSNQFFRENAALDDQSIATSPQKTVHIRDKGKNNLDLTELSEEKFAFGFSSK